MSPDEKIKATSMESVVHRINIINFVRVFETHAPDLLARVKSLMDESIEKIGREQTAEIMSEMFDGSGAGGDFTWLRPYCVLYDGSGAGGDFTWLRPYCVLYCKQSKIKENDK